jgi:hypothetical protein
MQPHLLGDLVDTERLGARSQQLQHCHPTGAGQYLVMAQAGPT